jgi:hypothetical protein
MIHFYFVESRFNGSRQLIGLVMDSGPEGTDNSQNLGQINTDANISGFTRTLTCQPKNRLLNE